MCPGGLLGSPRALPRRHRARLAQTHRHCHPESLSQAATAAADACREPAGHHRAWFPLQMGLSGCRRPPRPPTPLASAQPTASDCPFPPPPGHVSSLALHLPGAWACDQPRSRLSLLRGACGPRWPAEPLFHLRGRGRPHAVRLAPPLDDGRFLSGPTARDTRTNWYARRGQRVCACSCLFPPPTLCAHIPPPLSSAAEGTSHGATEGAGVDAAGRSC